MTYPKNDDDPPKEKFSKAAREFLKDLKHWCQESEIKGGFFIKSTKTNQNIANKLDVCLIFYQ